MTRVVVLAGGSPHAHDFEVSGRALVDLIEGRGYDVDLVVHPDDAAALLGEGVDALVVNALWWQMLGEAYEPWRATYGYSPPERTRAALASFVIDGGGLLAVHTAPICFDDWPEWGDLVGGAWEWGVSSHPPSNTVTGVVVGSHPVVDGLPERFTIVDEVYGDMKIDRSVDVLVVAKRHADDDDQPVVWAHGFGAGRVVFDCFGHDAASIRQSDNARLLGQAIDWIVEKR